MRPERHEKNDSKAESASHSRDQGIGPLSGIIRLFKTEGEAKALK